MGSISRFRRCVSIRISQTSNCWWLTTTAARQPRGSVKGRYVLATEVVGTAAAKNLVFREARGEAVLCCDSHVLFAPGVIARLKAFYREHPDCADLLQGPLLYDDLDNVATH